MKYKQLINFEPIETVTQLRDADDKKKAETLIKSYIMSDKMAEFISDVIIKNLRFDIPQDNKGIFIVGNYGTGKSHLMSVISSVAEYSDLLPLVNNQKFVNDASAIAGKFKVMRIEIGSVETPLRDMILNRMEKHLKSLGIEYRFPPADTIVNNKESLIEMMAAFQEKYPDHGYLIVIDELLDYLRGQEEHEMIKSLGFLRELGEVATQSRIRCMAGIQMALFDVPAFERVSQRINKVMDRFESLYITREDISYVVSNRLLRKDDNQKKIIRKHLEKFSYLYEDMSAHMDSYVELFPIHPKYLEVFERILIIEKREILKTISRDMRMILEEEVKDDEPGIISFDTYWNHIKEEGSLRTMPGVREVIDKGGELESIIESHFPKKSTLTMAMRIIRALCIYRLTTSDYTAPIGLTAKDMKDSLCLYFVFPDITDDFLLTSVETCMRDIRKTVSGKYISQNSENGQYYLDLNMAVNYDAEIEKRMDILNESELTESYYSAIVTVMNWDRKEYVPGMKIWEYELLWQDNMAMREGYLFLGTPADRPTAYPPHDFYIYFISPYEKENYLKENKKDEVFFILKGMDDELDEYIRMHAAAISLLGSSSGGDKKVYKEKAGEYIGRIADWLKKNVIKGFAAIYEVKEYGLADLISGNKTEFKEYIDSAASKLLSPWFRSLAPEYPVFKTVVTRDNREKSLLDALNYLNGRHTENGRKILESLELLEGEEIKPERSIYARSILEDLNFLGPGKVLNRTDILTEINGINYYSKYRLEEEWVFIIIASLIYNGDVSISISGKEYDAASMSDMTKLQPSVMLKFSYIKRPEGPPISTLRKLMELVGLAPGIANTWNAKETINKMQSGVDTLLKRVIAAQMTLSNGISLWGINLLDTQDYKEKMREMADFLNSLKNFNTPAKLKNFRHDESKLDEYKGYIKILETIESLKAFKDEIDPKVTYLMQAENYIDDQDLKDHIDNLKNRIKDIAEGRAVLDYAFMGALKKDMDSAKESYINWYMDVHSKCRLDVKGDGQKKKIMNGSTRIRLDALKRIKVVNKTKYDSLMDKLGDLNSCYSLTRQDMEKNPICPACGFNPQKENKLVYGELDSVEKDMEQLLIQWERTILDNIEDPVLKESIELLAPEQRAMIDEFKNRRKLPEVINDSFVGTIETLLEGLDGVRITSGDVLNAIKGDGTPCTVDEVYRRFDDYIKKTMTGKDSKKARIIID